MRNGSGIKLYVLGGILVMRWDNIHKGRRYAFMMIFIVGLVLLYIPIFLFAQFEKGAKNMEGMIFIPAGEFWMGNDEADCKLIVCEDDEMPTRKVYLDAYYIDKHEVTNTQYRKCVQNGKCEKPYDIVFYADPKYDSHPVVWVEWYKTDAYCKWVGKRLPTEAEWEKAARGGTKSVWPWGNEWDCKKSCNSVPPCSQKSTCKVGSFSMDISPYGVFDMSGNVWEWVADWYKEDYYKNSPDKNPEGPVDGDDKVIRGGSWWYYLSEGLRITDRGNTYPDYSSDRGGFRCAKDAE